MAGRDTPPDVSPEGNLETLRWLYDERAKGNLWALRDVADPDIEWEWAEAFAVLGSGRASVMDWKRSARRPGSGATAGSSGGHFL